MKIARYVAVAGCTLFAPLHAQLPYFAGNNTADTQVTIDIDPADNKSKFYINGNLTYSGMGLPSSSEGLLQNLRWVQATIDDTDGTVWNLWNNVGNSWDPQANTEEFIHGMDEWKAHGILGFTLNFQGGCQCAVGISGDDQDTQTNGLINNPFGLNGTDCFDDWDNAQNTPASRYLQRLGSFIRAADDRGMVVILGLFYFGQDQRLAGANAITAATERAVKWIIEENFTNVILEIGNESGFPAYDHPILQPAGVTQLVDLVHELTDGDGIGDSAGFISNPNWPIPQPQGHMLTSVSGPGNFIPPDAWIDVVDFVLIHGNGVSTAGITTMINTTRTKLLNRLGSTHALPVVFNEDDGQTSNSLGIKIPNMQAAYNGEASWGLYWDNLHQSPDFDPTIWQHTDMDTMAKAYASTLGFDLIGDPYCQPATVNSTGGWGHLYAIGSTTVSTNDVTLQATGLPTNTFGIFVVGTNNGTSMPPNSNGVFCLAGGQVGRYQNQIQMTGIAGCMDLSIDLTSLPITPTPVVMAGDTLYFQGWTRDGGSSNFTDAVAIMFQ